MHNKFCDLIQNKIWCTKLAYLADIFEHLNKLNISMQGKRENVLASVDKICALRDKIKIWIRKVKESNFESFPKTAECEIKNDISLLIIDHLILLQNKINNYFNVYPIKHPSVSPSASIILKAPKIKYFKNIN